MHNLDLLYKDKGLEIIGFPCNQIFWRELSTAKEIKEYISARALTFKVFDKVDINGPHACLLYKLLRKNSSLRSSQIGMNFGIFLVDREGNSVNYYRATTDSSVIIQDLEKLL